MEGAPCPQSRNGSPVPSPSSAADTATSPRWPRTVSNHGSRSTARPIRSPTPWTAPRLRLGSTSESDNLPNSGPRSKPSKSGSNAPSRSPLTKQHEFATVAQAEGVSLGVARRLLRVMEGPSRGRAVATLGRATLEAGKPAGPLLQVLDEAARPVVKQGTADEIFLAAGPS